MFEMSKPFHHRPLLMLEDISEFAADTVEKGLVIFKIFL